MREANPIAAGALSSPLAAFAIKAALVALVVAVVDICRRVRPRLAWIVLAVGIAAAACGALSNTHLTPFVTG